MEYAQGDSINEDEIRGMYANMRNEGTDSNRHGEGKGDSMNLVETRKILQKDVHSYKVDNERLMKSKDQHEDFNINLMQSLDRKEENMGKEIESIISKSQKSHDEREITRSVGMYHHHSPKHSTKRSHRISSAYPIRKHNKRFGVDELQGEMNKINPPTFYGEKKKDEDAETWLLETRKYFQWNNYSSQAEGRISIYHLKGKASIWWDQIV
jgi:hypothetical protein